MKALGALLAALAFAGCAAPSSRNVALEARGALATKSPIDARSLEYASLVLGQPAKAGLGPESPVIEHDGRRSYAMGWRLPEGVDRLRIQVRSLGFGGVGNKAILYPDVSWLDEGFAMVGRIPPDRYVYRSGADVDSLTADAFVDVATTRAAYLLITERALADAEQAVIQSNASGSVPVVVPLGTVLFVWMIPTGSTAPPARVVASPVGTFELVVDRPALRRIDPPLAPTPEPIR